MASHQFDFLDLKLYGACRPVMLVILDGIADVEAAAGVYRAEEVGLVESYAVEHLARSVVDKLELYMLQGAPTSFEVPKSITLRVQNTGFWFPGPKGLKRRRVLTNSGVISENVR